MGKLSPLVHACGVFVAGFGVMNIFSAFGEPTDLRGLYSYWSASLGDGIFLPVSAGAIAYCKRILPQVPGEVKVGRIGASAAVIIGMATQASWLLDADPALNWTLPEPHVFNAAGWYHAGFTIGGACYFAFQLSTLAMRLGGSYSLPRGLLGGLLLVGASLACFVITVLTDNADSAATVASQSTIVAVILGLIFALVVFLARRKPRLEG